MWKLRPHVSEDETCNHCETPARDHTAPSIVCVSNTYRGAAHGECKQDSNADRRARAAARSVRSFW
eukprot:432322-Prymnesium_polylepis.1